SSHYATCRLAVFECMPATGVLLSGAWHSLPRHPVARVSNFVIAKRKYRVFFLSLKGKYNILQIFKNRAGYFHFLVIYFD
ncbi:MAG: hypothetical protein IKW16_00720, partial [Clostridia bacterium]|nr:hypothetical protein [Clostridia bacterium]